MRIVTAVVSPSWGVQESMKRSKDCTAHKSTAKTRLSTTPATVPALMRVRSMGSSDLSQHTCFRFSFTNGRERWLALTLFSYRHETKAGRRPRRVTYTLVLPMLEPSEPGGQVCPPIAPGSP